MGGFDHADLWANRFVPGTGWGAAQLIETDTNHAGAPQIAIDADGNAVAVWQQSANIWANHFVPGTGWGSAQLIESDAGAAFGPRVTVDDLGNAVVVWVHDDGVRYNAWVNRFGPGTGWATAQVIETDDGAGNAGELAIDAAGNAVAVWTQNGNIRNDIWASILP